MDVVFKDLQGVRLSNQQVIHQDDGFGQSYKHALDAILKAPPDVRTVAMLALDPARKDCAAIAPQAAAQPSLGVLLLANTIHSIGLIETMKDTAYRETIASPGQRLVPPYLGLETYVNASLTGALIGKDPKPTPDAVTQLLGKDLQGVSIAGLPVRFDPARRQAMRWLNLSAVSSDGRVRSC